MNKIILIIKREYLTRVRNRAFILSTLLTPLLFAILIGGNVYFASRGHSKHKIAVIDANGFFRKI
jgi:ABC-2 type transport system permease protein